MSSDIVLTAALRNNLLSLQNTQSLIDKTQIRLATGLKVNSALDNPQSFFASQSLKNRATDISRLLDGIGQSIQAIQTADDGVKALSSLLDQAESLADNARSTVGANAGQATITGNVAFTSSANIVSTTGIDNNDTITFSFVDADGKAVSIDGNSGEGAGGVITFSSNETVSEILAQINGIKEATTEKQLIKAELTSDGYLKLTSLSGGEFRAVFSDANLAGGLGFGGVGDEELSDVDNAFTPDQYGFTVTASPVISSYSLVKNAQGDIADRTTLLTAAQFADPNANGTLTDILANDTTNDSISITINGATASASNEVVADAATATIQDLIDGINNNTSLNGDIKATYNETTGQIEIRALNDNVKSFQLYANAEAGTNAFTITDGLGFGTGNNLAATDDGDPNRTSESYVFGAGAGALAQIEADFDSVRAQIDQLVEDTSYRGTNLLLGDSLTTFFNEDRTNSLTVSGADLSTGTNGLNISAATFGSVSQVDDALVQVRAAKDTVRNFSSSLATSLNVLQVRQDFSQNLINSLQEGSDKLVVADQNEEGANLLALQTRQQLGVTSLSLASQSQQSVLRLF